MRNARQILDIVIAAFGQQLFDSDAHTDGFGESKADYHEMVHGWQDLTDRYSKSADGDNYSELTSLVIKASLVRIEICFSSDTNGRMSSGFGMPKEF